MESEDMQTCFKVARGSKEGERVWRGQQNIRKALAPLGLLGSTNKNIRSLVKFEFQVTCRITYSNI